MSVNESLAINEATSKPWPVLIIHGTYFVNPDAHDGDLEHDAKRLLEAGMAILQLREEDEEIEASVANGINYLMQFAEGIQRELIRRKESSRDTPSSETYPNSFAGESDR